MLKSAAMTLTASIALAAIALVSTATRIGSATTRHELSPAPVQLDRIKAKLDSVYNVISQQPDGVTVNKGQ